MFRKDGYVHLGMPLGILIHSAHEALCQNREQSPTLTGTPRIRT